MKYKKLSKQIEEHFKDLQVAKITEQDKKNKSIFDSVKDIFDKGVLSLVIKDTSKELFKFLLKDNLSS